MTCVIVPNPRANRNLEGKIIDGLAYGRPFRRQCRSSRLSRKQHILWHVFFAGVLMAHDLWQERVGIKRVIVDPDLIVKMRARGFSTTAHERDDVTFFDELTFMNENFFEVGVFGEHTLTMDDGDIIPKAAEC